MSPFTKIAKGKLHYSVFKTFKREKQNREIGSQNRERCKFAVLEQH